MAPRAGRFPALLTVLREHELADSQLSREQLIAELASRTGYSPATVKTYLSKKLEGRLVHDRDGNTLRIGGATSMSEDDFAALMSQKTAQTDPSAPTTKEEWLAAMKDLVELGKRNGYRLDEPTAAAAAAIVPEGTVLRGVPDLRLEVPD